MQNHTQEKRLRSGKHQQPVVQAEAADTRPPQEAMPFPTGEEIEMTSDEQQAPTVEDEHSRQGFSLDVKMHLPSARTKKRHLLPQTSLQLTNSGSSKELLLQKVVPLMGQKANLMSQQSRSPIAGRASVGSSTQVMIVAKEERQSKRGPRPGAKQNLSLTQTAAATAQQVVQQLGKPSLKLLMAQQTVKPDPAAKSPPITSNCQSQSSLGTTQTRHSPKSSVSNTASKQKTRNIQNSLGQLLQQTTNMFAKQQVIANKSHSNNINKSPQQHHALHQSQQQFPKTRKATAYKNHNHAWQTLNPNPAKGHSSTKHTLQTHSKNNQQPKVGKQLNDMLAQEGKPAMTGDIDDVANLISPSPRRNPGKIHSANRSSCLMKLETGEHMGHSLATEENVIEVELLQPQPMCIDSFDESLNINEFGSDILTPQLSATSGDFKTLKQAQMNPKALIQGSKQPSQAQRLGQNIQKQPMSSKTTSHNFDGQPKRQVPLQSSIETKKLTNKHPNNQKTNAVSVKPFNVGPVTQASKSSSSNKAMVFESSAASLAKTPKLFAGKHSKQMNNKHVSQAKATSAAQKRLTQQQSCDVIITTDGNVSDIDHLNEGRQMNVEGQKKAFQLFGPADSYQERHLETEQTASMVITRANESVNHLSRSLFNLAPQKKQSKMSIVPKQIEIELTFDGSHTQAQQLQANFQKNHSLITSETSKIQRQSHMSQTTKNSHHGAEMQTTVLNSFSNNNRELPLEERAPNTAVANYKIDLSLKSKTRSKFLNQTVIEKQNKNQSSKIQSVPSLSLNSFKTRPMAPVTSRNMSNAASLVKKANPAHGRNPNFKRSNNHAALAKDDNCQVALQTCQQNQDMSPLILQTKTLESFPAVADPQNKGILSVDKTQSLTNNTGKVRGKLNQNEQAHKKKNVISSSVDARRAFHSSKPTSVPRDEKNVQQRFSQLQKFSQANISIDLTMQNTQEDRRGSLKRHSENNPQYKTESLERILGSQAESYFRQIERTIQMGPVNVSQSQNRSQRQASCSQSSRMSGKTGKDTQMSLTMPGSQSFGMTLGSQKHQRVQNALVLEPRLASADKKSSFELTKINTTSSQSQSRPVHDLQNLISRPSGGINRDRFVAHRRIDLICDENADSNSQNTKGSLSNSLIKADHLNLSRGTLTRKKSDSLSSGRDVAATTPGGPKHSKPKSVKAVQSSSGKPESLGRKNQQVLGDTRNSKSSFGSNTRLQQSSKQSIAKDWVMCLPNEPPKVIETQPNQNSLKVEKLLEQKSAKKDSSIILHSEKSTSTRGGKSLLHPSAQKKMQQRTINASSRESMENSSTTQKTNLTKRSTMGIKAAQMAATIVRNDHRQLQVLNSVKTAKKQEVQKHPKIEANDVSQAHKNSLGVSKQLSEVAKVVSDRQSILNQRKAQNSQRSSSSLQISAQVSYNSKRQRDEQQVIVDQATASYLNISNTNMSEVQSRRPKSRQSLCTTSNKDQTSSHRTLNQYARETLNQRESFVEQKSIDKANKLSHNNSTNKKLRSSLVSQASNNNNVNHDLLFVTTDDEAAQYYDKLTSLFQETRQKIKEFNNDFSRGKQKEKFIGGGTYDVLATKQRSTNKKQSYSSQISSLDEPMTNPRESILSQEIRKDGKNTTKSSQLARRQKYHNHHRTGSNSNSNFTGSMISQSSHHRRQNQLNDSEKRQRERKPLQMNTDLLGETDAEYEERKRAHNKESHVAKKARKSSYIELNDERKKQQYGQGSKVLSSARNYTDKAHSSHMQNSAQKQQDELGRAATVKSKVMAEESNTMVDNYYQTNDESVDFMVSSKSKKIDSKLKSPQDSSKQPGHTVNKKVQAKGTKHSLTEMASTSTTKPVKTRRNNDTVQEHRVSTGRPQTHEQQHSAEQLQSQATTQPMPTNATIYINNLMNGVQTTQEDYSSSTMIGIPSQEMCRTQSQIVYPTSQQIFNSQQSVASGQQQFYNAMSHQQQYPHHPHMMQQNHNPQQQIVFVPVPVIQNSQNTIHSVPSAPSFMPSTHSQLNYQFPTQMSGPLFPSQNHSPQAAHAAALYAAAATMSQPSGQQQNQPFTYTMQQPGQMQNHHQQQFYQTHSHNISARNVQQNQLFSGGSVQTRQSQQARQNAGQQARSRQVPVHKQDQAASGATSKQKAAQQASSCQNCGNNKTNSGKTTTAQCKKAKQ